MDHINQQIESDMELASHPLMQDSEEIEELDDADDDIQSALIDLDSSAARKEIENLTIRNSQLMRIAADFENYKRRQEREREELNKFAGQQLITSLLPVLDNFERALQVEAPSEELSNMLEGVRMIHKQFSDILTRSGVTAIEAMGEIFNPEFHEAIMSEENDDVPDESVIGEFQRGYVMHGRLLRPSVVKVSKKS